MPHYSDAQTSCTRQTRAAGVPHSSEAIRTANFP
jgi:hypothetical protein